MPALHEKMARVRQEQLLKRFQRKLERSKKRPYNAIRFHKIAREDHWKGDMLIYPHLLETPGINKYNASYSGVDKKSKQAIIGSATSGSPREKESSVDQGPVCPKLLRIIEKLDSHQAKIVRRNAADSHKTREGNDPQRPRIKRTLKRSSPSRAMDTLKSLKSLRMNQADQKAINSSKGVLQMSFEESFQSEMADRRKVYFSKLQSDGVDRVFQDKRIEEKN